MEFRVLGTLEVHGPDGTRAVHGRKELCVLAHLLVHAGRAVAAEEIVTAVWGEDAPPSAGKSLQVRISHLRHDLHGDDAEIVRDGGGYRLAVDREQIDAHRFERLVAEAAQRAPAEALVLYDRALGLIRGRPYADVADLDFATAEVRRLDEVRRRALEGRIRALLDLGRHDEALPELERAARGEPLHEGLTVLHMLALYRAGRQVEALAAYRRLAAELTEMGLEPSDEARELEGRILRQDAALAARPVRHGATNLGARLTSFVDRAEETAAVRDRLGDHRLVTVCGTGGVGKTAIAAEAGRALLERFPDGVWLAELDTLEDERQLAGALGAAVGVPAAGLEPGAEHRAFDVLRDHLRDRAALLILDTCEHLAAATGRLVSELLADAPDLRVLATSRQPLAVAGEAIVEVRPLPADAAIRLFVERARSVRPDFHLSPRTRGPVEAICARLDGLPLALELAAARVRALSVGDIAARLDDRFTLLDLAGVVEWSHGLLSAEEQTLFRRLSVFQGTFMLPSAEAVATDAALPRERVAELLAALVDRSMIAVDDSPLEGYRLLQTLRAFGAERLAAAGELEAAADRHAEHFAARARYVAHRAWSAGTDGATAGLAPAREDVVAACDHALGTRRADRAVPLAAALTLLDYRFGDTEASRARLDAALALPGGSARDRLTALRLRAVLLAFDGRLDAASDATETAQLLADELRDDAELDRVRAVIGLTLLLARDVAGARRAFDGLEERFAARGDWWILGFVAGWAGFLDLLQGDLLGAQERSRRAVAAFTRSDELWGFLTASVNLGRACISLGDYDEAAAAYAGALDAAEGRIGDRIVPLLHDAGLAELRRGGLDRARELWARCAEAADRPLGTTGGWVLLTARGLRYYPLMAAGHLARLTGDAAEAARRYGQARALLEELERDARRPIGLHHALAMTLLLEARLADDEDRGADALEAARAALRRALAAGDRRLVARTLDGIAGALALTGEPVEAAELLGLADAIRAAAGGPLPAPEQADVDRVVARVRDQIGEGALLTALARGGTRDLRDVPVVAEPLAQRR